MTIEEVRTVCFVGAGTMGCANSLVAAVSGYNVVLTDARAESLEAVAGRHEEIAAFLVGSGYCTAADITAARDRVALVPDLDLAGSTADLVSESVFEDLALKRDVHRRLDQTCPSHTILTTNTSALLVSEIEDVVTRGDRFAALHSHLGSLLFDIVGGPRTTPETIDTLRRYVLSLGGIPLVLNKEHPGYVFNAMIGPLLAMALRLLLDGHATTEEIDRAWMSDRHAPMGPFGMMDLFGLDLMLDTWRRPVADAARRELAERVVPLFDDHVANGRLGLKSGHGFYRYPQAVFQDPGFVSAQPASAMVADALRSALLQSAVSLVAQDVAGPGDVDLAWKAATGLADGPLEILGRLGVDRFIGVLHEQVAVGLLSPEAAHITETHLADRPAWGEPAG